MSTKSRLRPTCWRSRNAVSKRAKHRGRPSITRIEDRVFRTYQFPTVNSVTISYALVVQLRCICGAKIVHATENLRIAISGCRFDLCNPSLRLRTHRPSDLAELLVARQQAAKKRNAELSMSN